MCCIPSDYQSNYKTLITIFLSNIFSKHKRKHHYIGSDNVVAAREGNSKLSRDIPRSCFHQLHHPVQHKFLLGILGTG